MDYCGNSKDDYIRTKSIGIREDVIAKVATSYCGQEEVRRGYFQEYRVLSLFYFMYKPIVQFLCSRIK